jgi:hypothetical protein
MSDHSLAIYAGHGIKENGAGETEENNESKK